MTLRYRSLSGRLRPAFLASILAVSGVVTLQSARPLATPTAARAQDATACPTSVGDGAPPGGDPRYVRISFSNDCSQPVPLYVDVAADDASEERGLMGVNPLPEDQGELFVFNNLAHEIGVDQVHTSFWMKDTPIPLSIAFIGKDGTINEIQDMQAESLDLHTPSLPYLYAVEANQGWFARNAISSGDKANLAPALALLNSTPSP
jgi:uncharacterized membrane protein (UPF0127 family)